jgi:hypothetical protein
MADSTAFDTLCQALEEHSSFDRLEARGTVRLALKNAGLDPRTVSPSQLEVVVDKLLPKELETRGVSDIDAVCRSLHQALTTIDDVGGGGDSPEDVFARLGGRS